MKILKNAFLSAQLLPLVLIIMVTGCSSGPKIASDLLVDVQKNSEPLINNSVSIDVGINPDINNYEKLDESVKELLEIALINANIFDTGSSPPYKISAYILVASQAAWSFGSFNGKLEIRLICIFS